MERINCYYAHAESPSSLQRRCYWLLDNERFVLVHYLDAVQEPGVLCNSPTHQQQGTAMPWVPPQQAAPQQGVSPYMTAADFDRFATGAASGQPWRLPTNHTAALMAGAAHGLQQFPYPARLGVSCAATQEELLPGSPALGLPYDLGAFQWQVVMHNTLQNS